MSITLHLLCRLDMSQQATEPVYLDKPLVFDWATGIGATPRTTWVTSQAVVFDKCMALATKALAHADAVFNIVGAGETHRVT